MAVASKHGNRGRHAARDEPCGTHATLKRNLSTICNKGNSHFNRNSRKRDSLALPLHFRETMDSFSSAFFRMGEVFRGLTGEEGDSMVTSLEAVKKASKNGPQFTALLKKATTLALLAVEPAAAQPTLPAPDRQQLLELPTAPPAPLAIEEDAPEGATPAPPAKPAAPGAIPVSTVSEESGVPKSFSQPAGKNAAEQDASSGEAEPSKRTKRKADKNKEGPAKKAKNADQNSDPEVQELKKNTFTIKQTEASKRIVDQVFKDAWHIEDGLDAVCAHNAMVYIKEKIWPDANQNKKDWDQYEREIKTFKQLYLETNENKTDQYKHSMSHGLPMTVAHAMPMTMALAGKLCGMRKLEQGVHSAGTSLHAVSPALFQAQEVVRLNPKWKNKNRRHEFPLAVWLILAVVMGAHRLCTRTHRLNVGTV